MQQATPTLTDDEVLTLLRDLVKTHGLAATAKLLGLTREPIARELAGIPTRNGTRAQLREALTLLKNR